MQDRLTYSLSEAAEVLGIGLTKAYEAVRDGTIPSIRIGRKFLIPRRVLQQMLEAPCGHCGPDAPDTNGEVAR